MLILTCKHLTVQATLDGMCEAESSLGDRRVESGCPSISGLDKLGNHVKVCPSEAVGHSHASLSSTEKLGRYETV